jgi:hypothetical protein
MTQPPVSFSAPCALSRQFEISRSRGKIRLQRERIELNRIVRGTGEDLHEVFRRNGVELDVSGRRSRSSWTVIGPASRRWWATSCRTRRSSRTAGAGRP